MEYESEESEESVATSSVGGAKKTAAKESTATKAGQVRHFCAQPAPSSLSSARRAVEPATFISVSRQCKVSVDSAELAWLVAEVQTRARPHVPLPPGYHKSILRQGRMPWERQVSARKVLVCRL